MLLKSSGAEQATATNDQTQTQKLEDFLSCLEKECNEIEAFKRELPLCMQLLNNAMETFRQELQTCSASQGQRPVAEELVMKVQSSSDCSEMTSNMSDNKSNWMNSAQLWSQTNDTTKQPTTPLDAKQRNGGGFLPFSNERISRPCTIGALPDLALVSVDKEIKDKKWVERNQGKRAISEDPQSISTNNGFTSTTSPQTHRKARRCWSPDLHRRFVNALQMLGGSQVATPKQIREVMKVDGLTNDEVKSHLQKYRLHTRRPSPNPQSAGPAASQLVVLGGIWLPSEYAAAHHGGAPPLYGLHPAHVKSQHYIVPQEYYSAVAPQAQGHHQLHNHTLHHQLHIYNQPSPQIHGSPESDARGNTTDQSERMKDRKSDKEALVPGEDGEESNESDITLKF
ncbi:hypothetical protein DCAR_0415983 [Daucus carota subsp. sativus]|uniref:HTH myb-type domain-containing protein n=1 Tax=Daucus carota subsp. sativus TaxID=79200 RepID=A0AAF1AXG3_DAUCS|nr:hypothetical protein DCAR_0415983 [Daucus carota subsp. sativus]